MTIRSNVMLSAAVLLFWGLSHDSSAQCTMDKDCPGDLICVNGECVPQQSQISKDKQENPSGSHGPGIYLIPKFGINLFNFRGKDTEIDEVDLKVKAGIITGLNLHIALHDYIALEPGVLFSMRGSRKEYSYFDEYGIYSEKEKIKATYLEIPLKIALTVPTGTLITPNLFFEPVLGLRLNSEVEYENESEKWNDITHPAEIALAFGAGSNFAINKILLTFETRFLFGLSQFTISEKANNWGVSFIFGTGFKIK